MTSLFEAGEVSTHLGNAFVLQGRGDEFVLAGRQLLKIRQQEAATEHILTTQNDVIDVDLHPAGDVLAVASEKQVSLFRRRNLRWELNSILLNDVQFHPVNSIKAVAPCIVCIRYLALALTHVHSDSARAVTG